MSRQDQPPYEAATGTPGGMPAGDAPRPAGTAGRHEAPRQYVPRPTPEYDDAYYEETGPTGAAKGLTIFAAIMLMLSGIMNFLEGLGAIINGRFYVVLPNYAFNVSVTSWGWWHLIMGVVVFAAGACLVMDMLWARIAGVVLAGISAVVNFLYIPYSPIWSVVIIALDVFVIWALLAPRNQPALQAISGGSAGCRFGGSGTRRRRFRKVTKL
jgi:hypothetical protein